MSSENVATVQEIYDAFTRGDAQSILAVVTDDGDWASEASRTLAPWHGLRHGKSEVMNFFVDIAGAVDVTEFTVLAIADNDTDVMAVNRFGVTSKQTGRSGSMDLHHWWRFRDGKVYLYRGTEDTALTGALLGTSEMALR
jgi:ketosteroid isomerase-like protein